LFFVKVNAFGRNGRGPEAIDLYRRISNDLRDEISYISVLNACSHSGLLDEARAIFNEINSKTKQIITTMVCIFTYYDRFSFIKYRKLFLI
jgi:pentatricopeptide repeat protein